MQGRDRVALTAAILCSVLASDPAAAFRPDHDYPPPHFWHGDIHRFHEHDIVVWRGGRWIQGFHAGRQGWWWVVGGVWYSYPAPIYPYPDPFTPPMVAMPPPGGGGYWYCPAPAGYYPYVSVCSVPWRQGEAVIVAPPPGPAPVPAVPLDQRTADERRLNGYGAAFADIEDHPGKAPGTRLRRLLSDVEQFRKELLTRSYNAMDILRDTEDLHDRIAGRLHHAKKG